MCIRDRLNILLTLAAGALVGVFNGFGIVRLRIPPFIMTLSTMCIVNGVALKIRPVPGGSIPYEFMDLLFGRIGIFPHAVLLWAVEMCIRDRPVTVIRPRPRFFLMP